MASEKLEEKAIFNVARQIDSADARLEYLGQVCGPDADLLERVQTLLRAYEEQASFLESPPADNASLTIDQPSLERPGTQIGRYKLLEPLGEGGMGAVYVAEQTEPVRRRVALKIIKPGMDTRQVIARFEAERQALALMDHPNIARVLDAGTTSGQAGGVAAGRPYFVMELVRGIPITEFCDERRLDARRRLELFVQVCRAIQHAHQKGVIHRDIKPSNILVTLHDAVAVPKVIDFGVAKAMGQRLTEQTVYTAFHQMIGTPLYMSPEQAEMNALDVDTRSDVYSLGVLLYELLTGNTPFDRETMHRASLDEMRRLIRQVDPPSPSQRVSTLDAQAASTVSNSRGVDERQLQSLLRRDLDWIVMRALEKDRNRRYESASAMAADVQRYLNSEAVEAGPVSAVYRLQKFWRRNKAPLVTATLILATLVAGAGVSIWQAVEATYARKQADAALDDSQQKSAELASSNASLRRQTERAKANLKLARDLIDKMFVQEGLKLNKVPHLNATQRQLFQSVVEFYEELPKQETGDPDVRWETGQAYFQLSAAYWRLNQGPQSAAAVRRAISVYAEVARELPNVVEYQRELCHAQGFLGIALTASGDDLQARKNYIQAISGYRKHVARFPDDAKAKMQLSDFLVELVSTRRNQYATDAIDLLRESVAIKESLVRENGEDPNLGEGLTRAWIELANELFRVGQQDEALTAVRKAIGIATPLVGRFPDHPGCREYLAEGHLVFADFLGRRGNLTESERNEAIRSLRECMRINHQLGVEVPDNFGYRFSEGEAYYGLSTLLPAEELESHYRNWTDYIKSLVTQFPEEYTYRQKLTEASSGFVDWLMSIDRPEEAERWALEYVQWSESLAKQSPGNAGHRFGLIQSKVCLFRVLDRLKRWPDSDGDVSELVQDAEKLVADDPYHYRGVVGDQLWDLFVVLTKSTDPQVRNPIRAAQLAVTAFKTAFKMSPDSYSNTGSSASTIRPLSSPVNRYRVAFGQICDQTCDLPTVVAALGDCKDFDRHARPAAFLWLAMAHCRLDQFERALDTFERAIAACDEAESWMRDHPDDVDDQMRDWQGTMTELMREVPAALVAGGSEREAHLATEKCIAWHRRMVERDAAPYFDYARLAWMLVVTPLADLGDYEEAIRLAEKSLSLSPNSRTGLQALGVAYYRLGRFEEAAKQFELLADLIARKGMDRKLMGYYFPAMTQWQLGNHDKARASYAQAEEILANDTLPTTQLLRAEAESMLGISGKEEAGKAPD